MRKMTCIALVYLAGVFGPNDAARAADVLPLIKQAIERGVAQLKTKQMKVGNWDTGQNSAGSTALAGVTLLECDVPPDDPVIQAAADHIRQASLQLNHIYSISLSIMFLDRLGDPADIPLIESLTMRLLASQTARGGWDYNCLPPPDSEVRRLTAQVQQHNNMPRRPGQRRRRDKLAERRPLTKEIEDQLKALNQPAQAPQMSTRDDNSNTQFATLALWVASRYELPVDAALARIDARFRLTQNVDGGWGYIPADLQSNSTSSMTCAGLLGLAVGHGARKMAEEESKLTAPNKKPAPNRDLARDPVVRAGLQALGTVVGVPRGQIPRDAIGQTAHFDYYFLWSLERVAVAYGLDTIGNKDWYRWGAELLLGAQDVTGGWGDDINTSFALLYLRRTNLAEDLTATLRGMVGDPGEVFLRGGGVGGASVKRFVLKPGDNPHAKGTRGRDKQPAAPGADLPADVASLVAAVLGSADKQQAVLIAQYQENKGVVYTQALAASIHRLEGRAKDTARDALRDRLYRMSAETLRDKLQDDDSEVRSAAALACGMKKESQHVPDLIARLEDGDRRVARAAAIALKNITNQEFGPAASATAEERARAVAAWKAWWSKQHP